MIFDQDYFAVTNELGLELGTYQWAEHATKELSEKLLSQWFHDYLNAGGLDRGLDHGPGVRLVMISKGFAAAHALCCEHQTAICTAWVNPQCELEALPPGQPLKGLALFARAERNPKDIPEDDKEQVIQKALAFVDDYSQETPNEQSQKEDFLEGFEGYLRQSLERAEPLARVRTTRTGQWGLIGLDVKFGLPVYAQPQPFGLGQAFDDMNQFTR